MLPDFDPTGTDVLVMNRIAALDTCDIPEDDPNRPATVDRRLEVSLVVHRDVPRLVLHFCVAWPAYEINNTQNLIGFKVIEIRNNPDKKTVRQHPFAFRFSFRRLNSASMQHWNFIPLGMYDAEARDGILNAFRSWSPKPSAPGNCITCIFNVLKWLAERGFLGAITDEKLQEILENQREIDRNTRAFDQYYVTNSGAPDWEGP